jgi:hypothetical protein
MSDGAMERPLATVQKSVQKKLGPDACDTGPGSSNRAIGSYAVPGKLCLRVRSTRDMPELCPSACRPARPTANDHSALQVSLRARRAGP